MSGDPKEQLGEVATEETTETREVYLREGRTLTVATAGGEELVEIRSSSGQVEVRIRLTEQGPVLQLESARLELRAAESIDIATRQLTVTTEESITMKSRGEVKVEAEGEVDIDGKKIHLN